MVLKDWLHVMYVSTSYMCIDEHNKKMNLKI